MGVAHGLFQRDVGRADDGVAIVERGVVVSVGAEGKADLLLPWAVAVEVGKEVVGEGELLGYRDVECVCCHGVAERYGGGQRNFRLGLPLAQELTLVA